MANTIDLFKRVFALKDLRDKLIISGIVILIFRALAHIPLPEVDTAGLASFLQSNQMLGLLDLFSGGAVSRFSIVMLGVGPYITASIIMQLMTATVPALEELQKEGEYGRQKINQYTRYLSVPLAIIEAFGLVKLLENQQVILIPNTLELVLVLVCATAGSTLLMWLGEYISEKGIGNGISLIIAVSIVAGLPAQVAATSQIVENKFLVGIEMALAAMLMIVFIVFVNEAERRIPVSYARRIRAGRALSAIDSYLPIKANSAGVIPIIFATSVLIFPGVIVQYLQTSPIEKINLAASKINTVLANGFFYGAFFFALVFFFTFFYTSIVFRPQNIAENLQKQGGFIPGVRPGAQTASYLGGVIYKITFAGASFLAVVAIFPLLMQAATGIDTLMIGGTGVLIIVSVTLEMVRQIKAQLVMRSYDDIVS